MAITNDITISNLTLTPTVAGFVASLTWEVPNGMACLSYMQPAAFKFYHSLTNSFGTATLSGQSEVIGLFNKGGLTKGATYYVWARAVDSDGNEGVISSSVAVTTLETAPGPGSVGPDELADDAVETQHIANLAVSNAKIANGAITEAKIGNAAITTAKIDDAAITSAKIGSAAITSAKIDSAAITNAKIDNLAVTSLKIGNNAVLTEKMASHSVSDQAVSGTGSGGPGSTLCSIGINSTHGFVLVMFSAVQNRPAASSSNVGSITLSMRRNGSQIAARTIFYDDNFSQTVSFFHADGAIGNNTYSVVVTNNSGAGNWTFSGAVIGAINFRR